MCWELPRNEIVVEINMCEVSEVTYERGYGLNDAIVGQSQSSNRIIGAHYLWPRAVREV